MPTFPDDYQYFRGFWWGKDGTGPHYVDPLGVATPIGGGGGVSTFAALTDNPTDNNALNTALGAKADLVGGVIPQNQLPAGVGSARQIVRAVTTGNVTIATALNNGDTVDGVTLATNDLVLVAGQTTKSQNGIYVVGAVPARSTSYDTFAEHAGLDVVVTEGTAKAGSTWRFTSGTSGTIDVTDLLVAQISLTGAALAANNLSDMNATTVKTNLGLDAVDNTADADKPVSTAQQTALDTAAALRLKISSGAPSGGVNGEVACRTDTPFRGMLYAKAADTWSVLAGNVYTWATKPTAGATYEGLVITISNWDVDFICKTYDAGVTYRWVPLSRLLRIVDLATTVPTTASGSAFVTVSSMTILGGLVFQNCKIKFYCNWIFENLTANIKTASMRNSNGNEFFRHALDSTEVELAAQANSYHWTATQQFSPRAGLGVSQGGAESPDGYGTGTSSGPSSSWDMSVDQVFNFGFFSVTGETTLACRNRSREIEIYYP